MEVTLSSQQAQDILALAHIKQSVSVKLLKKHNHVFELKAGDEVFYVKTYTKDWYRDLDEGAVRHEAAGYAALSSRGIPAVPVLLVRADCDNPLRRPFLLTKQLRGRPLTELLRESKPDDFKALLRATGSCLRRYHDIVFRFPGYIGHPDGPQEPPAKDGWLHFYCSAERMQNECLAWLEVARPKLSPALADQLREILSTMKVALAPAFSPPRFIQGDCHAHQFFLFQEHGGWHVSGSIDMEVASAGAPLCDLLKFNHEMMEEFSAKTRWWEPLFEGYGGEPDFAQFRLMLLGDPSGPREQSSIRILAATNWEQLFDAGHARWPDRHQVVQ